MALNFPWEMYAQAAQRKDQKKQQDLQYMQGIGQTINDASKQFADRAIKNREKEQWQKTINGIMNNPNTPQEYKEFYPLLQNATPGEALPFAEGIMKAQSKRNSSGDASKYANQEQALGFAGNTPENQKFFSTFQNNQIPWGVVRGRKTSMGQDQAMKDKGDWVTAWKDRNRMNKTFGIYKQLNVLDKSSGNVLGSAANIQFRAQRGDELLNSKNFKKDARVYALVQADLAAIAQGGPPTLAAQAEAELPTIKQDANRLLQKITAQPESIQQPEVRKQLTSIFRTMGHASSTIIDQNTNAVKALWKHDPEASEMINDAVKYIGSGVQPVDPATLPAMRSEPNVPASKMSTEDLIEALNNSGGGNE